MNNTTNSYVPGFFNSSTYHNDISFKNECKKLGCDSAFFSLIHFNVRSICKNLTHVDDYLQCLNFDWSVIGFTETWYQDHNVDLYNIPDYKQENNYRKKKIGVVFQYFLRLILAIKDVWI